MLQKCIKYIDTFIEINNKYKNMYNNCLVCNSLYADKGDIVNYPIDKRKERYRDCCTNSKRRAIIVAGKANLYLRDNTLITDITGKIQFTIDMFSKDNGYFEAWFNGPDDKPWYGVKFGNKTHLIYCKRV